MFNLTWYQRYFPDFQLSGHIEIAPKDVYTFMFDTAQNDVMVGSSDGDLFTSSRGLDVILGRGGHDQFIIDLPTHKQVHDNDPQFTFISGGQGYDVLNIAEPAGEDYRTVVEHDHRTTIVSVIDIDDGHVARTLVFRGIEQVNLPEDI